MLNFCSLYSGSSGNSLFVQTDNTNLLIDAGVSSKKIEQALNDIEVDPHSLDGILITHEHSDHVQGFKLLKDNKKISIATDIGHMTNDILKNIDGSSFILLESNYDPEVLKCSHYPYYLKTRIAGPSGHLSNEMAGKTISFLLKSGLKNAMLGHLSKESNFPELAYKTVIDELLSNSYDENSLSLSVAKRDSHSKIITI